MYKFFLILFLSASLLLSSQINTQLLSNTSWTHVKSIMQDGSRDLSLESYRFLVWKIKGNNICESIDPWAIERTKCKDFKFEKNLMKLSDKSAYEIETLTSDSLIVIQKVDGITFPDKIRKMKFVKTSILVKNFTNNSAGDSIIITSRNITPTLTKGIITEMMDLYSQKKSVHNFIVDGEVIISPKKQKIEVKTDNKKQNKDNQKSIDLFKTTLQEDYKIWDITGYENFDRIIIPYRLKSEMEDGSGSLAFYNLIPYHESKGIAVNVKDRRVSSENFNKGLGAINSQKFDNAIYFFNQAYEYDNTNTDALYNIVSISIAQNKTDVACTALKKLKDLEQTEGTRLYNEKCSGK
ncbi:DNA ligase-like domain-containing protein [Chryseobacterium viscerum]|uniref:Tetratricopeptide repeat protein n=1 Tax=Chryseobacterium viscerum TaxID=1037377 RepID=A0A5N4BKS8_9FLAO|nr:hypothetical protein [Chryseobacterium viscerum]KAB1229029.1 hypothetical protein F8D52_19995 [Chryseobacterium viscerum]